MNIYALIAVCLFVIVIALVIYIVADKYRRRKEIDELIEFLIRVQDKAELPEPGNEAEGNMSILRSTEEQLHGRDALEYLAPDQDTTHSYYSDDRQSEERQP